MSILNAAGWNAWLANHPQAHILQTAAWGELKSAFGWRVVRLEHIGVGAQLLFRRLPLGFQLAYMPKGPVGDRGSWDSFWPAVKQVCHQENAILLLVEPDAWEEEAIKLPPNFRYGNLTIQPRRTIEMDLSQPQDEILARMKQKTRYNIRLSNRKGVQVTQQGNVDTFFHLMQATGVRDGFGIHTRGYYQKAFDFFAPQNKSRIFIASFQDKPLAAIMVFASGDRAWYFYGASSDSHRELMPAYALQWQAMLWAKERGCRSYDFWGVPDADFNELEASFTNRSDGLWGVYRFKRGFGGMVRRFARPIELPLNPVMDIFYRGYLSWQQRRTSQVQVT